MRQVSLSSGGTAAPRAGAERRLSRRLIALNIAGIAGFVLVILATVFWISAEHNALARAASERLVRGGIASFRTKIETVVSDYSIWDEAYAAFRTGDQEWLYRNIGTGAAEIGALDIIVLVDPATGAEFGWRVGSPVEGEPALLPAEIIATALDLLADPEAEGPASFFAQIGGEPWAIAVTTVRPVDGPPAGLQPADMPRQVHGLRMAGATLERIAANLMLDDLVLVDADAPLTEGLASEPLLDSAGATIAALAWGPPRPGASILAKVALPLGLAVTAIAAIAAVLARYSVRSTARLEAALEAAQSADRAKTDFLSNISHELRTPMNGIVGVAQLLAHGELTREQRELVAVLQASADAQLSLINDLLNITRMESGNRELEQAPFVPARTLSQVVELMRPGAEDKGLRLDADLTGLDGFVVVGDEAALRQIATNLVGNAVKFTPEGRVEVTCSAVREGRSAEVVLRVADTGPGIAAADHARIFDRFVQVDASRTRTIEGTGLGLAISQSLAALMGSRVEVESAPGTGATFTLRLRLPLAGPDSAHLRPAA